MYNPKEDQELSKPVVDKRETIEHNGRTVYWVHGAFEGSNVKFSFYFPEKEDYEGRFYQYLSPFPGPDEEVASLGASKVGTEDSIGFAVTHGAYMVETNMGSGSQFGSNTDATILYRASAAAAEYSRVVAMEYYDTKERPYGYVYGGSGGGYKTCACIEMTSAFDGAVPFVTACPAALPYMPMIGAHARRVLRHKFDAIADAVEAGAETSVYDILNQEERDVFDEVSKMGLPQECWVDMKYADDGSLPVLAPTIKMIDPTYFTEFWETPGYLGADKTKSAIKDRICVHTTVSSVVIPEAKAEEGRVEDRNLAANAWQKMISDSEAYLTLDGVSGNGFEYMDGLTLTLESGKVTGMTFPIKKIVDGKVVLGAGLGMANVEEMLQNIQAGDTVFLDNSDYIAVQTYHRHQVPAPEFVAWDQFRNEDGTPMYPQRPFLLCLGFAEQASGALQTGDIQGKTIMVNCAADGGACTWMAEWYKNKVAEKYGKDLDEHFRLYVMEHCGHDDVAATGDPYHVNSYLGGLFQALVDVAAWTERGIEPAQSSQYQLINNLPALSKKAEERRGIHVIVTATANGEKCVHVGVNEEVTLHVAYELPTTGDASVRREMTKIDWSFEDSAFGDTAFSMGRFEEGTDTVKHAYSKPGTYFVTARVHTNRKDDFYLELCNMDRVRVVVE